jgi:AAA domain
MEALLALQKFVAAEYKSKVALDLLEVQQGQIQRVARPTWQWQTQDLVPTTAKNASGALLLDEEIGLCLFVQSFGEKTDLRAQLAKTLQLRSALRPRRQTIFEDVDELGEWSVAFLWLAEPAAFERWIVEVADLRQQTSHFEEVSADALVNHARNWPQSCSVHGVPRLLLNVRAALNRKKVDETVKWIGADLAISERLKRLPSLLPLSLAKYSTELSSVIESGIAATLGKAAIDLPPSPSYLHQISMRNFRNVGDLILDFRDEAEIVGVNIIQGPNGTGKSSISEAIAIALSGVSNRYLDFISDGNESTTQGKADKYIKRYLSPIGQDGIAPQVGLNGEPKSINLAEGDDVNQRLSDLPVPGPATTRTKRSVAAVIPCAGDSGSRSSFQGNENPPP